MSHGKDFPKVKLTCCGMRHLNGTVALAYARCRHAEQGCKDGDVGRAKRQQKVIFGIRDKVLSPENFPELFAQAPQLYRTFSSGIHTNLTLSDAMKLAVLVRDIPEGNIRNAVIDNSMITFGGTVLGGQNASVLRPDSGRDPCPARRNLHLQWTPQPDGRRTTLCTDAGGWRSHPHLERDLFSRARNTHPVLPDQARHDRFQRQALPKHKAGRPSSCIPQSYILCDISSISLRSPEARKYSSSLTPPKRWISKYGWGRIGSANCPPTNCRLNSRTNLPYQS